MSREGESVSIRMTSGRSFSTWPARSGAEGRIAATWWPASPRPAQMSAARLRDSSMTRTLSNPSSRDDPIPG
jgi:hypothetical protein